MGINKHWKIFHCFLLICMSIQQCYASAELLHSSTGVWAQGNNVRGRISTFVGSLISFPCALENKTKGERLAVYPMWWFVADLSGLQHKHSGWFSILTAVAPHGLCCTMWGKQRPLNSTVGSAAVIRCCSFTVNTAPIWVCFDYWLFLAWT